MPDFSFDSNVPLSIHAAINTMRKALPSHLLGDDVVNVHWGRAWWSALGFPAQWVAAASVNDVYFTEEANPSGSVAHELWHVVQKRNGGLQFLEESEARRLNLGGEATEGEAALIEGVFRSETHYNRFANVPQFPTFLSYAKRVGITLPDWSPSMQPYSVQYYTTANLWKATRQPETIAMHATRSGRRFSPMQEFNATVNHFQNSGAGASTEFVVGPGVVAAFVAAGQGHTFEDALRFPHWHLGLGRTEQAIRSVGIEVVQSFPDDAFDPVVMNTVFALLQDLNAVTGIPLVRVNLVADPQARGVFGHEDVKPGNTDPGWQFDWDWALTGVQTPDYAAALQDMQDERDAYGAATGPTAAPATASPEDVIGEMVRRIEAAGRALLGEE